MGPVEKTDKPDPRKKEELNLSGMALVLAMGRGMEKKTSKGPFCMMKSTIPRCP